MISDKGIANLKALGYDDKAIAKIIEAMAQPWDNACQGSSGKCRCPK